MGITRVGLTVTAAVLLLGVMLAGPVSAGGMGGYNPGYEGYGGGTEPTATKAVKPGASIAPTASDSESVASNSTGAGAILSADSAPCADGGRTVWWVTVAVAAAALLWFGRTKGSYLWLIALYAVLWFGWAWKLCDFGFSWLPVLLAVVIWLLSVPRPSGEAAK